MGSVRNNFTNFKLMPNSLLTTFLILFLSSCTKADPSPVPPPPSPPSIKSLNCASYTAIGSNPVAAVAYAGQLTVPYSGGNGVAYSAGSAIASTGVTGLTATLQSGTLTGATGNFVYSISGTPSGSGTAAFALSFSGQSCTVSLPVAAPQNFTQYGAPFAGVVDRQDATIYQVNIRAFSAQSNFAGVTARLDSIKALGANVIYLMPIHPVGSLRGVNSPYSIKDYAAINPEFGTLNDLRALVDGAHSRNMSVIMDWVANHTAWDNPWISSHSDWYLKDAAGVIVSPPGMGWNDVAQLDFSNAAMRQEMIRMMKYWVYTANVDGFRCDYADGPPQDFWKAAVDSLRAITTHKLLLLAEGTRNNHFAAGFDFTFGFGFFGQLKNIYQNNLPATAIDGLNNTEYESSSNGQQVVRYLTNHDVNGSDGTPLELFGGIRGSAAAFVVVAYMKSVPMIYNGQEVGMNYRLTFPFTGADINWSLNPDVTAEYKRIIHFRNASTAIRRGALVSYTTPDVCAFTKELGSEKVFVVSNLRNSTQTFTLPSTVANTTWINAMTGTTEALGQSLTLPPYTYLVLKN
jgi:glycosidase